MSGNLTVDRNSGYTSTQLNDFFDDFVSSFNGVLPNGISVQNGNLFSAISINESDSLSSGINNPRDILEAISYLGQNLSSNGSIESQDTLSNSTWSIGRIPTDTITSTPSYSMFVWEKNEDGDEFVVSDFVAALAGSTYDITPYGISEFEKIYTGKAQTLSNLGEVSRHTGVLGTLQPTQQSTNAVTGVWNTNSYLQNQSIATKSIAPLGNFVTKFYSQSQVQPLSNSGGTTWQQTSFTEEEVDDGLSDNHSRTLVTRESFEDVGFNDWMSTTSALTTLTIEYFSDDTGITSGVVGWFQNTRNNPSRLTFEGFTEGYEEGTYPSRICNNSSSSSSNEITENISTQINGSTQIFTLTNEYVSGSLRVYWNGQRQIVGDTITERSSTSFSTSFLPLIGQYLNVDYVKQD